MAELKKFSRKTEMMTYQSTSAYQKLVDQFCISPLPYYSTYALAAVFFWGLLIKDQYWYLPWVAFSLIPALDLILPVDLSYPANDKAPEMHSIAYKIPLWGWAIVATAALYFSCERAVSSLPMNMLDYLMLAFSCALITGGFGITVSHELFHKPDKIDKIVGTYILVLTSYMHFVNEHLHGHHSKVATPEDPASAARGQTFYNFYIQTVVGSWNSSWKMETEDLLKKGKKVWSLHNKMIWYAIIPFVLAIMLALWFQSFYAFIFFYVQAIMGFTLLEIVNYVEHYGLRRFKNADGAYEPVRVTHSWNAPHTMTNFFLFKLQRHSDHHAYALRPYQILRNFVDSPQLPTGYAGMIILALFPPLFFLVMDKRIDQSQKFEESLKKQENEGEFKVTKDANKFLRTDVQSQMIFFVLAAIPTILLMF